MTTPIRDEDLADNIILRLNELLTDKGLAKDICDLFARGVPARVTTDHPTVRLLVRSDSAGPYHVLNALGLINGFIGAVPSGYKQGWGYITAVEDDHGNIVRFERTEGTSHCAHSRPACRECLWHDTVAANST